MTPRRVILSMALALLCFAGGCGTAKHPSPTPVASINQALASQTDVWGDAALKQSGGPSYEFFEKLLPPLRYCDAPFRYYPITLAAPRGVVKARLVSNGSQINALARQPNWIGETGTPITFRVGRDLHTFGSDLTQLVGPTYADGYLPIVQLRYTHRGETFTQESFASADDPYARYGVVMARIGMPSDAKKIDGKFEVQIESTAVLRADNGVLRNADGKVLACFDPKEWEYIPGRCTLNAWLNPGQSASLAIYTVPAGEPVSAAMTAAVYDAQRRQCTVVWNELLARGTQVDVPEPVVNNAWRATLIGNFMLVNQNLMRYSQGNQYAGLYIGEGGDAARAFMLYGHPDVARDVMGPLFAFTRKGLEFHQAGFKLQMLAHYYFLTRDAGFVKSMRVQPAPTTTASTQPSVRSGPPGWQTEIGVLTNGREPGSGLFPPEKYAGDLEERVVSLNSNANGWRGLRDVAVVFDEIGEHDAAAKLAATAAEFRSTILSAVARTVRRDVNPPFVPLDLLGNEQPYRSLVESRASNYYNIMIKYVLGSGIFPIGSEFENDIVAYQQQRGGLCMGMNRSHNRGRSFQVHELGINELYGMRYAQALLRRDEPDRALVSFYGKLAQGMTRDTFIGGEGASITPIDQFGRQTYLPPNSAANANFLQQLRYLLIGDYDTDDDGRADTLRLLFATPRRWLDDGNTISVRRAPTMFGETSLTVRSRLKDGEVIADVKLPSSAPSKTLLRLRLPTGWRITGARANGQALHVDGETVDLSPLRGDVAMRATVARGRR